jgi:hypothetical protein
MRRWFLRSRYSRLVTAAGASYGPEIIIDGGFTGTADWTLSSSVTISGGTVNWTASSPGGARSATNTTPLIAIEAGAPYKVDYDITAYILGGVSALVGGAAGATNSALGSYSEIIIASDTTKAKLRNIGASTTLSVDNLSVRKVL